jgi:putative DeoR family transcriptional regulator (stage III sporulation protein D)
MLENNSTVRKAASVFGVSKSTVHKDITTRLQILDKPLYRQIVELMEINKKERHIRGGLATRLKYIRDKEKV